jgi:hypothetical protein
VASGPAVDAKGRHAAISFRQREQQLLRRRERCPER